jgi:hypothetical protein
MLLMIERFTKSRRVLEIGTLFGNTTLNLAANTDGSVTTLDLPPEARCPEWASTSLDQRHRFCPSHRRKPCGNVPNLVAENWDRCLVLAVAWEGYPREVPRSPMTTDCQPTRPSELLQ